MSPGCLAGTRTTLVNWVQIRGPCQLFSGLITLFHRFSAMNKEGPLRIHEAVPLLSPKLWQVATHAPKGVTSISLSLRTRRSPSVARRGVQRAAHSATRRRRQLP